MHLGIFEEAIRDDSEVVDAAWDASFEIVERRAVVVALGRDRRWQALRAVDL